MESENNKKQKLNGDILSNFVADNEGNVFFDEHSIDRWSHTYHSSRKWLVCIDESNWSKLALLHALNMMDGNKRDELSLLHVVEKDSDRNKMIVPLGESEELIIQYFERKTGKKLNISHKQIITGDPRKIILEKAKDWDPTYIVMGARGQGDLEDLELGSVAQYITQKAKASVIVVRPNNENPEKDELDD
eukprot:TRINITY_DN5252_c0_g1_i1.p1 TRINITY_DN5252_c0_g1~~TRINITY_DN5252_c0_g1_i1.p1  ORF type:complete len:190 (+),score=60.69 TRINITY_DN5252_c0_g1_i1:556-1125(+)